MISSDNNSEQEDFSLFKDFLSKSYGIVVTDDKRLALTNKLQKLFQVQKISGFRELINRLQQPDSAELRGLVMQLVTINETSWCRDTYPFDILQKIILPEIHRKRPMDVLRVWSAACSAGQEPYSISMIIEEIQKMHPTYFVKGVEIVATDISQSVLSEAQAGEYDDIVMSRGLPDTWKNLFFDELPNHHWRIKPTIKQRIKFKLFNLLDSYVLLGKFDVIFCRNVLVYFPQDVKVDILKRMHKVLNPGGYLIVGATEIVSDVSDYYQLIQCNPGIVYRAI